jgi:hypothetical protein
MERPGKNKLDLVIIIGITYKDTVLALQLNRS